MWPPHGIVDVFALPCIEKAPSETYPVLDNEKEKTETFWFFGLDKRGIWERETDRTSTKKSDPHEMLTRNSPTKLKTALHTQHSQPPDTPVTSAAAAVSVIWMYARLSPAQTGP